eukprot:scaffold14676_cov94-Skeletonema_dohrnii-CCMP3373.AAC.1
MKNEDREEEYIHNSISHSHPCLSSHKIPLDEDLDNTVLLKKLLTRNREIDEQYEVFGKGDEIA